MPEDTEKDENELRKEISNILIRSFWPADTHLSFYGLNGRVRGSSKIAFHTERFAVMCGKFCFSNLLYASEILVLIIIFTFRIFGACLENCPWLFYSCKFPGPN
jgi:hypothetical protein